MTTVTAPPRRQHWVWPLIGNLFIIGSIVVAIVGAVVQVIGLIWLTCVGLYALGEINGPGIAVLLILAFLFWRYRKGKLTRHTNKRPHTSQGSGAI